MKVLMLGWEFPPYNSGGLGVACHGIARALTQKGVDVLFVLPKKIPVSDERIRFCFADIDSLDIRRVDTALVPYVSSDEYARRRAGLDGIYGSDLFAEVRRYAMLIGDIARKEQFDVIHAHDWLSFLAGIEAKRVSGKPLIIHVHITSFDQAGGENVDPRVFEIERAGMRDADMVVTVSEYTKQMVMRYHGIHDSKIRVVYNGIEASDAGNTVVGNTDPDFLDSYRREGYKIVLFVGRITLQKGPDYFLRAAALVLRHHPKTLFVVAGSGDMEWRMIDLAAALGISKNVFFTGFTRGEELLRLFRSADLFVLSSVSEPFGITPLEALVNGTPVLISKQSGVSEVLSHALKVDFWDVEEMANKIVATLKYEPLARQLSSYGFEEVLQLTWSRAADACIALYRFILDSLRAKT